MRKARNKPFVFYECPVAAFQQIATGKHKLRILWDLRLKSLRYGELKKSVAMGHNGMSVTARVLSRELKRLTVMGMVNRKDYQSVPPKVEYSLTERGKSLVPVIKTIRAWGLQNLKS